MSTPPEDIFSFNQLAARLQRFDTLQEQAAIARQEQAAEISGMRREVREVSSAIRVPSQRGAIGTGEEATLQGATNAAQRMAQVQTESLRAVQQRVIAEQEEGRILAANAARLAQLQRGLIPAPAVAHLGEGAPRYGPGVTGPLERVERLRQLAAMQGTGRQPVDIYGQGGEQPYQPHAGFLYGGGAPPGAGAGASQAAGGMEKVATQTERATTATARYSATAQYGETEMRRLAIASQLAADSAARHGYLTSETIQYMLKGQLTARQLGNEMLGTIAKFTGWTAAATAVYGAAGALGELYKGALQARSGVGLVERILPNVDTSKLQQSFRDLSEQFNLPIEDVVQAVYGSAKVFNDQADAVSAAASSLFAVKVGELSAAQSTQYLTAIVNGFNLSAQQIPEVFDAINQAQNKFGGNTGQLIAGVAKAGGVFKLAGGNYKELIALIETGTKVTGGTGESIGTAIARSSSRVLTPQGAQALRGVGITPGGTYMDILTQAFQQAQHGTPAQVNAIARALVPAGGQFARVFAPILENRQLFDKVLAELNSDRTQGSAARELSRALSQPDEQLKALMNGVQRLGAALGQLGVGTGLGVLVRSLNIALTLVTHFLDTLLKIPGVDVAAPWVALGAEVAAVARLMRYFNVGGSLSAGRNIPEGSLRSVLLPAITKSPDAELATRIEKDQVALQRQTAEEASRAQLATRASVQSLRAAEAKLELLDEGTAEYDRQLARVVRMQEAQLESSIRAVQLAEEVTLLREQTNKYDQLRRDGMAAEQAAVESGIYVVSPTADYGQGGTPEYLGGKGGRQGPPLPPGTSSDVAAAASVRSEQALAAARVESATATGAAAAGEEVLATARAASAVEGAGGLLGKLRGLAGGLGSGARSALGARVPFGALGTVGAVGAVGLAGYDLVNYYKDQEKKIQEFNKAASGDELDKAIKMGTAQQQDTSLTVGGALSDLTSLRVGHLYKTFTHAVGQGFLHAAAAFTGTDVETDADIQRQTIAQLKSRRAHLHLAEGTGIDKADMQQLVAERTVDLVRSGVNLRDAVKQANQEALHLARQATRRGTEGRGTLLTQSQIRDQAKQAMAGAQTTAEQIAVYQTEIDQQAGSYALTYGGRTARRASRDTVAQAKSGIALIKAEAGDLTALAQVLSDGSLSTADAIANLTAQIGQHGLTRATLGQARTDVRGAVRDLGKAIVGRDPGAQAKALESYKSVQSAIEGPAQDDLSNALAVAITPAQKEAARKRYLQEISVPFKGLQEGLAGAREQAFKDSEAITAGNRRLAGPLPADTRARVQANVTKRTGERTETRASIDAYKELIRITGPEQAAKAAEQLQANIQDQFSDIDARANLASAKVAGDPAAQARVQLGAINRKLAILAKAGLKQSADYINLLAQAIQQQQTIVNTAVQDFLRDQGVNAARFAVGASQGDIAAHAVTDAQNTLAFLSSQPKGTVTKDQWAQAFTALYTAEKANADYIQQQATAMIDANAAYAAAGTNDPLKQADIEVQRTAQQIGQAQDPASRRRAQATHKAAVRDRANLRWSSVADTIEFNLSMERIDSATAAAEYGALAAHVKNNKALRRQYLERQHALLQESQTGTPQELNVGNIRFPTAYEVMRGIGQASKASSRTLSTGNVHATANATINVNVANKGDVGAVSDAIDQVLTTHVRSTLRAKGVLGG